MRDSVRAPRGTATEAAAAALARVSGTECDMGASLTRNKKKIWNNKSGYRRRARRTATRATVDRRRIV